MPVVTITSPSSAAKLSVNPLTISGTASVAGGTITNVLYRIGGTTFAAVDNTGTAFNTWSKSIVPPEGKDLSLVVRACGDNGRYKDSYRTFTFDATKPQAGIASPTNNAQVEQNKSFTVSITNSDATSGVKTLVLTIDGVPVKTWTDPAATATYTHTFADTSSHTLRIQATDDCGNASATKTIQVASIEPLLAVGSTVWYKGDGTSNGTLQVDFTLASMAETYFVVVDKATPPTAAEIKAGVDYGSVNVYKAHTDTFDTGSTQSWSDYVTGLTIGVETHVYILANDGTRESPVLYAGSFKVENNGATPAMRSLIISEYIEGEGDNKAIEIYNGTGYPISLNDYKIAYYSAGSTTPWGTPWAAATYGTILATGQCYVFGNSKAATEYTTKMNKSVGTLDYNGDDAVALLDPAGNVVDCVGQIGIDPGEYWGSGDTRTMDKVLRRKLSVLGGVTGATAFDPATEWVGHMLGSLSDEAAGLGSWQE